MSYQPPQPPPPGGYGQPYAQQPAGRSGKAVAALVTGLAGLLTLCCGLFVLSSIAAIVLGFMARSEIAKSGGRLQGAGMALAGIILGSVMVALFLLIMVLFATGAIEYDPSQFNTNPSGA